jgi:hypothetical protein
VTGSVPAADVTGLAVRRMQGIDTDYALVDVIAMYAVEVPVVQVVDVVVVPNRAMTTVRAVDVIVSLMNRMRTHRESFRRNAGQRRQGTNECFASNRALAHAPDRISDDRQARPVRF